MTTRNLQELISRVEQIKRYIRDYTYSALDDWGSECSERREDEDLEETLKHPIHRKVQAPPPENLSDEEWNNLMGNIGAKN